MRGANLGGANLGGANLGGADLRVADLCVADLRDANLRGADLYGADLYGADLLSARDIRCTQIFVAFAPHMSSRNGYLYGGFDDNYNLIFWAGCFVGSADKLSAAIIQNHPGKSGDMYHAAIAYIEACYNELLTRPETQAMIATHKEVSNNG